MELTLGTIVTDAALIATLLFIGVILRARTPVLQKMFMPASIIAGVLGLIMGPSYLGWLSFSSHIAQYPGILITLVFGSLGLSAQRAPLRNISGRVGSMWAFGNIALVGMYGAGVLFSLLFIAPSFSNIPDGFGLMLAVGFVGGHGTAAAIGEVFAAGGWYEATSLGMTSATIGVLSSIIGGILIIRRGSKKGHTHFVPEFKNLPQELRTGLIPEDKRSSEHVETVSPMTIDPLLFHLILVVGVSGASFWLKSMIDTYLEFSAPAFALAFIAGIALNIMMHYIGIKPHVSNKIINRIGSSSTDLLVAFGIASINLSIIANYWAPLLALVVFGLVYSYIFSVLVSRKMFKEFWFEKGIFGWGWFTGTVAMGIALLRIVDPKLESKTLDDFALGYIFGAPIEIVIVTFSPLLIMAGHSWLYVALTFSACAIMALISLFSGWTNVLNRKDPTPPVHTT